MRHVNTKFLMSNIKTGIAEDDIMDARECLRTSLIKHYIKYAILYKLCKSAGYLEVGYLNYFPTITRMYSHLQHLPSHLFKFLGLPRLEYCL